MRADDPAVEALLRDWQELASGDRKAVLGRLPAAQRMEFQRLLAAAEADRVVAGGQRYRGYSTWLARLLADCEAGAAQNHCLKPALAAALIEGHQKARGPAAAHAAPATLREFAGALLQRLREAL